MIAADPSPPEAASDESQLMLRRLPKRLRERLKAFCADRGLYMEPVVTRLIELLVDDMIPESWLDGLSR